MQFINFYYRENYFHEYYTKKKILISNMNYILLLILKSSQLMICELAVLFHLFRKIIYVYMNNFFIVSQNNISYVLFY